MAKCNKCGAIVPNDELICPVCHEKIEAKTTADEISEKIKKMGKTEDYTGAYSKKDAEDNQIMALLCYIPLVCLYPLICEAKKSPFVKFHANAGLVLFIAEILAGVILEILGLVFGIIPFVNIIVGIILRILSILLGLSFFAGVVYGIYQTITGKAIDLPIIGKIRILK